MQEFTIKNEYVSFSILDLGASITSIKYNNGRDWVETTMQYEDRSLYSEANPFYLNCIVGPHAGRIKDGVYKIGDQTIQLERSSSGNHLHGGSNGFHKLVFDVDKTDNRLELRAFDPSSQIDLCLTYTLLESSITIDMIAKPKFDQVVNMTQHTYFNLGSEKTIKNHFLKVNARSVAALDDTGVPTNNWLDVAGTPFDFFAKRRIGDALKTYHSQFIISNNIDHPFKTNTGEIILESEESSVGLSIESDSEYTVIYAANYFDNSVILKDRGPAEKHEGLAIEPQDLPNDVNIQSSRSQIYGPSKTFSRKIIYKFYTV